MPPNHPLLLIVVEGENDIHFPRPSPTPTNLFGLLQVRLGQSDVESAGVVRRLL